jgi:hypothetical protein
MEHPVLVELETRAGASDADRAAWLIERLGGVTATQARDLYLSGAGYRARLLEEKAKQIVDALLDNKYVAWGNTREPIIANWARRFGIEPESRVFRAADNPRYLASPDGLGVGFDDVLIMSEIKTGKDDIAPGTNAFERKGYDLQMQWGMRVTGARRCLYIWEQHDSDWQDRGNAQPEPAPLHPEPLTSWVEYNAELADELEQVAASFLADLDALVRDLADGIEVQIDDELDTLAVNLLRFRALEAEGKKAKETTWKAMQERLEGCDALNQKSALVSVTYNPGEESEAEVLDAEAAKLADPDLFAEVTTLSKRWNEHAAQFKKTITTPAKPSLTVTAVKPPKEKKA